MTIELNLSEMHLWRARLDTNAKHEQELHVVLNADELARANKFVLPLHKQRYVMARGILRNILAWYLDCAPEVIQFSYGDMGKPYIANTTIQFNVSHSHQMAVYAITKNVCVGVDIEKIEENFKESVAKRYFSPQEYASLMALSEVRRVAAFYQIWSCKEALIKALGVGLYFPLKDFSVSLESPVQQLALHYQQYSQWHLESFTAHTDYAAAFATPQIIQRIIYHEWSTSGPVAWTI
jgi:4'-phosphopantetheinyl transferase